MKDACGQITTSSSLKSEEHGCRFANMRVETGVERPLI